MDRYTATNEPQGITHKALALYAMIAAALVLVAGMVTGSVDLVTLANKLLNVAIVLVAAVLFNHFYLSRRNDVDAQIFSHPIALALYGGAVVVACGVAVSQ